MSSGNSYQVANSKNDKLDIPSNLTPSQYQRMMNYLEKIKKGENVENFILDHPKNKEEAQYWSYKFWKNNPVPDINEKVTLSNIIDPDLQNKYKEMTEPQPMCEPYKWVDFNINDDKEMDEVVQFLNKYYKDDTNGKFMLYYTKEYIRWALG